MLNSYGKQFVDEQKLVQTFASLQRDVIYGREIFVISNLATFSQLVLDDDELSFKKNNLKT
jgi:hypothetical protein